MLTWKYIGVLNIKGKHNFKHFFYIHIIEIPKRESTHENVQSCPYNENREYVIADIIIICDCRCQSNMKLQVIPICDCRRHSNMRLQKSFKYFSKSIDFNLYLDFTLEF